MSTPKLKRGRQWRSDQTTKQIDQALAAAIDAQSKAMGTLLDSYMRGSSKMFIVPVRKRSFFDWLFG